MSMELDDEEALGVVLLHAQAAGLNAFTPEDLIALGMAVVLQDRLGGVVFVSRQEVRRMARVLVGGSPAEA